MRYKRGAKADCAGVPSTGGIFRIGEGTDERRGTCSWRMWAGWWVGMQIHRTGLQDVLHTGPEHMDADTDVEEKSRGMRKINGWFQLPRCMVSLSQSHSFSRFVSGVCKDYNNLD